MSDDFREELLRVAFVLLWHKTVILELPACLLLIIPGQQNINPSKVKVHVTVFC